MNWISLNEYISVKQYQLQLCSNDWAVNPFFDDELIINYDELNLRSHLNEPVVNSFLNSDLIKLGGVY